MYILCTLYLHARRGRRVLNDTPLIWNCIWILHAVHGYTVIWFLFIQIKHGAQCIAVYIQCTVHGTTGRTSRLRPHQRRQQQQQQMHKFAGKIKFNRKTHSHKCDTGWRSMAQFRGKFPISVDIFRKIRRLIVAEHPVHYFKFVLQQTRSSKVMFSR